MRAPRLLVHLAVASLLAGSARAETLVVLEKSDHAAALLDGATREVVARLPTGKGPHEVAVSADGRTAWVSNYGAYAVFRAGERPRVDPGHTITVLDLAARKVVATWDLGRFTRPHGIRASRDGTLVWATAEGAKAVVELEARSGKVLRSWNTGQEVSHMLAVAPDERRLFVANIGSGSVTVIDRASGAVRSLPTGAGAEGIEVSPDGREVWVANRGDDTLSVLDGDGERVRATFPSGGRFPIRLQFTPDGSEVWVSNARSDSIAVFDARARKLVATVEVGAMPVGILVAPDGRRAFVASTNADRVSVVDVSSRRVLRTLATGKEPDGLGWGR